ncbi:MAG: TetR/AcrR family transcriptional regulator [Pseudonocardia sp.]
MPRGVAIPELHERLFDAAERLLVREGPAALSTRAITTEAGCAKGVLHNHFTDLDGFLTEFVLACFQTALHGVAELPTRAGHATVVDNLSEAADTLFGSPIRAAHAIVAFRPAVAARLRHDREHHAPTLVDLERVFSAYLEAEKEHGRISATIDTSAVAFALVATVHHLLMTGRVNDMDPRGTFSRVIDTLLGADVPANPPA